MKSGVMTCIGNYGIRQCKCGNTPELVWYFTKGTANHVNYFVRCKNCKIRTGNRKHFESAVIVWNNEFAMKVETK